MFFFVIVVYPFS